jgi:serine/threonine protein kinase
MRGAAGRLTGTTLADKYRIEYLLGSGGMCEVYRARHTGIGKQVAVKILKPELAADPKIAERFEQEARASSRVRHPNAIDVTDFGIAENNTPFLVMELVEGNTVRELLREYGPFPVPRVVNILSQVCGALEAAHTVGVIHRDIKPDNIIISEYDGRDWVEVVDFGVAKIQEDFNRRSVLTGANFIIGTPRYMSPEQCEEQPVDARSDIYSLGVVVYEMLSGEAPFDGGSSTRLLMAHVAEPPPPLGLKRPDISPEIEALVMRALEKNPNRRPQSAAEFARDFERAAGFAPVSAAGTRHSGPISRISVPLDESRLEGPAESIIAQPDVADEATLVRRPERPDTRGRYTSGTLREPAESNIYDTLPDIDERIGRRAHIPWIIGVLFVSALIGFLAFLIFGGRSPSPETRGAEPAASDQAASSSPAAPPPPVQDTPAQDMPVQNTPVPGEPTEETTAIDTGEIRRELTETITGAWQALESKDLNSHMRHYAPRLAIFYLQRDVSRAQARAEIERSLSAYDSLDFGFDNVEIRVDPSGREAIATYDKSWNFEGGKPWKGAVKERLWLVKRGGRWLINGVRDLRVLR